MVSVFVFRSVPQGTAYEVLAEAEVRRGELQVRGRRVDLVDPGRKVYSSRLQRLVAFDEDREEWLRSFAESFRTAQVGAAIAKDTTHKELVAPREMLDQLQAGILA